MDTKKPENLPRGSLLRAVEKVGPQGRQPSEETGENLVETVVSLTGLPDQWIRAELTKIIEESGHRGEDLTLEQLRSALLGYLESLREDVNEGALEIPQILTH